MLFLLLPASRLSSLLGTLGPRSADPMRNHVVVLGAGVLQNLETIVELEWETRRPGVCKHHWVVDGNAINQKILVQAREAFGHFHLIADRKTVSGRRSAYAGVGGRSARLEVGGFQHQRVSFKMPAGTAEPFFNRRRDRGSIERDNARLV